MDDLARLELVIDLCSRRGLLLSRLRVGSVELQIAGVRADRQPDAADVSALQRTLTESESVEKKKLAALRKRSQEMFGKILPDEVLQSMDGAL